MYNIFRQATVSESGWCARLQPIEIEKDVIRVISLFTLEMYLVQYIFV